MTDSQIVTISQQGSDPIEVTATVTAMEYRQEPSVFGATARGLYAQIDITSAGERPAAYILSRLVDETHWIIDAHFTANGFPVYSNGFGARYLRVRTIAPELAALLDAEARARQLATSIGPDTPMELAAASGSDDRRTR